jgi:hypothetical protein
MLPIGSPGVSYVSGELSGMQFQTLEAVVGAAVGFDIFAIIG